MTAGNQPSSSGSEQPRLSPDMVLQEARSLVAHLNSLNKPYSSGVVADCIATIENLVSRLPSAAQGAVSCGNLTFGTFVENIAASDRNPIKRGIFIRKTSAKMAEYATKEGCHSTPLDNLRVAPSLTSTNSGGAAK